jgi:hypothetical protein
MAPWVGSTRKIADVRPVQTPMEPRRTALDSRGMELDFALLADSAAVYEGKTSILGGGVSVLWRPQLPAPLGVFLVAQVSYHRTEVDTEHILRIQVMDADGNAVVPEISGEMRPGPPLEGIPANVPLTIPVVVPFPPVPVLQRTGMYSIELLLDDRHVKTVSFGVAQPPAQE